jgi:hypothetical protein
MDASVCSIVIRKTGGHPSLSVGLSDALRDDPADIAAAVRTWAGTAEDLLLRVVEDHGIGGRGIVVDLLTAGGPVEEMVLLRRRFAGDAGRGLVCLKDLTVSGLLDKSGTCYSIRALMLKEIDAVRRRLNMPVPSVPIQEREEHTRASELVYEIENRLRQLVVVSLGGEDGGWWSARVPTSIATEAESLWLKERDSHVGSPRELHPVMYLTLGSLYALLVEQRVWAALRTQASLERSGFDDIWREFVDVRNKVAHSRPASAADVLILERVLQRLNL